MLKKVQFNQLLILGSVIVVSVKLVVICIHFLKNVVLVYTIQKFIVEIYFKIKTLLSSLKKTICFKIKSAGTPVASTVDVK